MNVYKCFNNHNIECKINKLHDGCRGCSRFPDYGSVFKIDFSLGEYVLCTNVEAVETLNKRNKEIKA